MYENTYLGGQYVGLRVRLAILRLCILAESSDNYSCSLLSSPHYSTSL